MTPFLCIRIVLVENYSCIFDTSAIQDGRMSREDTTAWMQDAYIDVGGRECREHILEVERIRRQSRGSPERSVNFGVIKYIQSI